MLQEFVAFSKLNTDGEEKTYFDGYLSVCSVYNVHVIKDKRSERHVCTQCSVKKFLIPIKLDEDRPGRRKGEVNTVPPTDGKQPCLKN